MAVVFLIVLSLIEGGGALLLWFLGSRMDVRAAAMGILYALGTCAIASVRVPRTPLERLVDLDAPKVPTFGKDGVTNFQSLGTNAPLAANGGGSSTAWKVGMALGALAVVAGLLFALGARLLIVTFLVLLLLMKLMVGLLKPKVSQQDGNVWRPLIGSALAQALAAAPLLFFGAFIVPKFAVITRDLGVALPGIVAAVVSAVDFVNRHGWLMGGVLSAAAFASGLAHRSGGTARLRRWTFGVAAALFGLFVATVAVVIIPMMCYAPQVIHRMPERARTHGAPPARSWHPLPDHSGNERGTVFVTHDNVDVIYALYHAGQFGTGADETFNPKLRSWHSKGVITLNNGRKFLYLRVQDSPETLRLNGDEFDLTKGRVIVLYDDGRAEQRPLFPPLAVARQPAALAKLVAASDHPPVIEGEAK